LQELHTRSYYFLDNKLLQEQKMATMKAEEEYKDEVMAAEDENEGEVRKFLIELELHADGIYRMRLHK